jgi:hypothetical protein
MLNDIQSATLKLLNYCRENQWAGYDPYDALNSKVLTTLPFLDKRLPRIAMTQALKRSPINIRPLLSIPKTQNPKALALFLSSLLRLSKLGLLQQQETIGSLIDRLIALRSPGMEYWCWGYSFPWQTRRLIVPAASANLVCTVFVANALLDAYEELAEPRCLTMAASAAEYLLNELYWCDGQAAGFSYPLPSLRNQVYNANFLAAALLCRVHRLTGNIGLLNPAMRATRWSVAAQDSGGSWNYGAAASQRWIDNFHTGYNLCALRSISKDAETSEFDLPLQSGFAFYIGNFFREDGAAKYFHNRTYPIDIHAVAQSVITLLEMSDLNPDSALLAHSVLDWAMKHMWDERGFFYYRVLRLVTIRTSYMRWSQAWMLLAMTNFLSYTAAAPGALAASETSHS